MTKKSTEEILTGAARGEPMNIDERNRLRAALDRSAWLRAARGEQDQLTADLAGLRDALRTLRDPADREQALRNALGAQVVSRPVAKRMRARVAVAGLVLAAAVLLVFGSIEDRADRASSEPPATGFAAAAGRAEIVERADRKAPDGRVSDVGVIGTFQPLMYAPGFSPSAAYSVVRVRIPVSALAVNYISDLDGIVEADILIGEDGLPTAIRFASPDALASTFTQ